jgi:hypothetical protein
MGTCSGRNVMQKCHASSVINITLDQKEYRHSNSVGKGNLGEMVTLDCGGSKGGQENPMIIIRSLARTSLSQIHSEVRGHRSPLLWSIQDSLRGQRTEGSWRGKIKGLLTYLGNPATGLTTLFDSIRLQNDFYSWLCLIKFVLLNE